jgi:hypothetical protein
MRTLLLLLTVSCCTYMHRAVCVSTLAGNVQAVLLPLLLLPQLHCCYDYCYNCHCTVLYDDSASVEQRVVMARVLNCLCTAAAIACTTTAATQTAAANTERSAPSAGV